MADEYDGRVVIDTELDNSGFEKGTDKLISAMKGVERTINGIGETASHAFDVDHPIRMPVEPELPEPEELAERVAQVEKELPPVWLRLDSKEYDKTTERLQAKTRKLMAEINRMANTTAQGFKSTSSVVAYAQVQPSWVSLSSLSSIIPSVRDISLTRREATRTYLSSLSR